MNRTEMAQVSSANMVAMAFAAAGSDKKGELFQAALTLAARECIIPSDYGYDADGRERVSYRIRNLTSADKIFMCPGLAGGAKHPRRGMVVAAGKAEAIGKPTDPQCDCPLDVCPLALAALLTVAQRLNRKGDSAELPPWYRPDEGLMTVVKFRQKWESKLEADNNVLDFLLNVSAPWFHGTVEVDEPSDADEFIADVATLLNATGKVSRSVPRKATVDELVDDVKTLPSGKRSFAVKGGTDLEAARMWVIRPDMSKSAASRMDCVQADLDFVIERLCTVVKDRFYLIVGTRRDIENFLKRRESAELVYGPGRIRLRVGDKKPDALGLYGKYVRRVGKSIMKRAPEGFEESFGRFVAHSRMPFEGDDLVNYLVRLAQIEGRPKLPEDGAIVVEGASRTQLSAQLEAMLAGFIGLEPVKEKLRELQNLTIMRRDAMEAGLSLPTQCLHMLFLGSPGTGKTSFARVVAKVLFATGAISSQRVIEVTARDLVSEYVSETPKKTREVLDRAKGGVLFIDEAYALAGTEGGGGTHGHEAIVELVAAMENEKSDLVVILAGYTADMHRLLDVNVGLRSRIGFTFEFPDYDACELRTIFSKKVEASGLIITEDALDAAEVVMEAFCDIPEFGNGRFADRVLQETLVRHARTYRKETLAIIDECDIPSVDDMAEISALRYIPGTNVLTEGQLRRVAMHEAGHAIVRLALTGEASLEICVRPGGSSLGYTRSRAPPRYRQDARAHSRRHRQCTRGDGRRRGSIRKLHRRMRGRLGQGDVACGQMRMPIGDGVYPHQLRGHVRKRGGCRYRPVAA